MGLTDIVLIVLIVGGAVYLPYRSIRKKKGSCHGCDASAARAGPALSAGRKPAKTRRKNSTRSPTCRDMLDSHSGRGHERRGSREPAEP